jgi:hypothetical protein
MNLVELERLAQFASLARILKPRIHASQLSTLTTPPASLPESIACFLASAVGLAIDDANSLWSERAEQVWYDGSVPQSSSFSEELSRVWTHRDVFEEHGFRNGICEF